MCAPGVLVRHARRRGLQHDSSSSSSSSIVPMRSSCSHGNHPAATVTARLPGVARVHAKHVQHVPAQRVGTQAGLCCRT